MVLPERKYSVELSPDFLETATPTNKTIEKKTTIKL
jgi:hypothetical protein